MQRRDLNAPDAYHPVAAYTQAIEVSGAARTLISADKSARGWTAQSPTTSSSRAALLGKILKHN